MKPKPTENRKRILALLKRNGGRMNFTAVHRALGFRSHSLLHYHLVLLEAAGVIVVERSFHGRQPVVDLVLIDDAVIVSKPEGMAA